MSSPLQRGALAALLGLGACFGADAQTQAQTPPPPQNGAQQAASPQSPASAPAAKKKHGSRAKTPPGKPPTGTAHCSQGDKAQRQRCLNDMYGPGGPRI